MHDALIYNLWSQSKLFFGVELDFYQKKYKEIYEAKIEGEVDGINEYFLVQIDAIKKEFNDSKNDKEEYVIISNLIVRCMAELLHVDSVISSAEKEAYDYIAKNLGVKNIEAESMLRVTENRSKEANREAILKTFEMIPNLTKKQIAYIESEYYDLKKLHDMSEEDIRGNLPGISKATARAIKKKLNEAFK